MSDAIDKLINSQIGNPADIGTLSQFLAKHGDGRPIEQTVVEMAEKYLPRHFQTFYPRRYNDIGPYSSPKTIAAYFCHSLYEVEQVGIHKAGTAIRLMLPALFDLARKRMPSFFIAPGLLNAVKQTDYKDPIEWQTMKLPHEHGIIVLPKGAVLHPKDGYVSHILWSRLHANETYPTHFGEIPSVQITNNSFCFVALCPEQGTWFDSNITAEYREKLDLRNVFYRPKSVEQQGLQQKLLGEFGDMPLSADTDTKLTEEDAPFLELLAVILFGTLLAMNCRPELVEMGRRETLAKKRDGTALEYWSPNIIGGRYQVKRVPGKGVHASPTWHWRRGFWRNQPYGPGNRDRKMKWLEPTMVNYKDEEK